MVYLGAMLGSDGLNATVFFGRVEFDRSTITIAEQIHTGRRGRSVIAPPKSVAARQAAERLGERLLPRRNRDPGQGRGV